MIGTDPFVGAVGDTLGLEGESMGVVRWRLFTSACVADSCRLIAGAALEEESTLSLFCGEAIVTGWAAGCVL